MKKTIGVEVKPPGEECGSSSCAWHGTVSIRGRVLRGVVRHAKSKNTAMVEWGYHKFIPKYERYERRKTRVTAHNPDCIKAKEGDVVVIGECRPLSKTKHFIILAKLAEGQYDIKGEDLAKSREEKRAEKENKSADSEAGKREESASKEGKKEQDKADEAKDEAE
jgi:small subunit ribosomal protein S17